MLAGLGRYVGLGATNAILVAGLSRLLPERDYQDWVVLLQVALSLTPFEVGLNEVLTRRTANRQADQDGQVESALALAAASGAFMLTVAVLLNGQISGVTRHQYWWHLMPFIGIAFCHVLSAPLHGHHRGSDRLPLSVACLILGRAFSVTFVLAAAAVGATVWQLGLAFAAGSSLSLGALAWFSRRAIGREVQVRRSRTLLSEGAPIGFAQISVLLITGADVFVVSEFAREDVAGYAAGAMLVKLATSAQWAAFAGVPQRASMLRSRVELVSPFLAISKLGTFAVALPCFALLELIPHILRVWIGDFATPSSIVAVQVLVVASLVRNLFGAWYLFALGTGDYFRHRRVPYAEATINITISILCASRYGAVGASIGTLCGGAASSFWYLTRALRQSDHLDVSAKRFARQVLIPGLGSAMPIAVVWPIGHRLGVFEIWTLTAFLASLSVLLGSKFVADSSTRQTVSAFLRGDQ